MKTYINHADASKILKSEENVLALVRAGKLQMLRINGSLRYDLDQIRECMK